MASALTEVFPQLGQIVDDELRDKVEKCWLESLKRGGWEISNLETIPFTMLSDLKSISLASHTRNVTNCSIAVAEVMNKTGIEAFNIDFDLLIAGGILHDVGKAMEYGFKDGKWFVTESGRLLRHPISGATLAAEMGFSEKVQHMIAVHSHEGDKSPRLTEAWIVHHCDFINFDPIKK